MWSCINSFYSPWLQQLMIWQRCMNNKRTTHCLCCSTPPLLLHSCTTIHHLFIYHVWLISSGVSLLWAHTDAFPCSKPSGAHAVHKALQCCAKVSGFAGLKHSEQLSTSRGAADQCSWYSLLINAAQCCSPATKHQTTPLSGHASAAVEMSMPSSQEVSVVTVGLKQWNDMVKANSAT